MSKDKITDALRHADETKFLKIESNILHEIPAIFREQFPGKKGVVIADGYTFEAAGGEVHGYLSGAGLDAREPFIPDDPELCGDYRFVVEIREMLAGSDAVAVSVGTGVINDLVKRASGELGRPYMTVATAASMDGYSSYGAALTKDGNKATFDCPAPRAIIADLAVICNAPPLLTASGYADLYAKIPAGADWILADALGIEPMDPTSWHIVQDGLEEALRDPAGAREGKRSAVEPLVEGLMLGGFAMQSLRNSRPASGADHHFSHIWEMEHHTFSGAMARKYGLYKDRDRQAPSHGFKVGIGLLSVLALYDKMLATPIEDMDIEESLAMWEPLEKQVADSREMFRGEPIEDFVVEQVTKKYLPKEELRKELTILKANWPEIRAALEKQLIPYGETKRRLALAGAPVECEQIGISREKLHRTFFKAQRIRERFTVLDVAFRIGYLNQWVDELFSEGGALKG